MSEFVEVNVSELFGATLDWAVAKAEGLELEHIEWLGMFGVVCQEDQSAVEPISKYSADWSQGGPLISKYHLDFCCEHPETIGAALCDENGMYIDDRMMFGETHLIAACRAIVASVLGDTVSVPKELLS